MALDYKVIHEMALPVIPPQDKMRRVLETLSRLTPQQALPRS